MPTPERTSLAAIVDAGRDILETAGPTGLTMQAVAERVGVRAPSLYKRIRDRDALLTAVAEASADALTSRLETAGDELPLLAAAYRSFAGDHLPAAAAHGPAASSLAGAFGQGDRVLAVAREAFMHGLHAAALAGAVTLVVAAVALLLADRTTPSAPH